MNKELTALSEKILFEAKLLEAYKQAGDWNGVSDTATHLIGLSLQALGINLEKA